MSSCTRELSLALAPADLSLSVFFARSNERARARPLSLSLSLSLCLFLSLSSSLSLSLDRSIAHTRTQSPPQVAADEVKARVQRVRDEITRLQQAAKVLQTDRQTDR